MLAYNFETKQIQSEAFDGPLELLLYLIRQHGVDIRDVHISPITDAFLAHLESIKIMNLDTAGDFLVMAATLCYLKSRELLPNLPIDIDEDEERDPMAIRRELAQRLINYKRYKDASRRLAKRSILNQDVFASFPIEDIQPTSKAYSTTNAYGLLKIFRKLVEKTAEQPTHVIEKAHFSMQEMGSWLFTILQNGQLMLHDILLRLHNKADRIVCFLTILELARLEYLDFFQEDHLQPIVITPKLQDKTIEMLYQVLK